MLEKLKSFIRDDHIFMALLLVVSCGVSFFLGRSAAMPAIHPSFTGGVVMVASSAPALLPAANQQAIVVVASRNGTKYHLPTCPGAKQITAANKVEFASIASAAAAGYEPAANCAF